MSGPKETAYDAEISPLMVQIIDVCKRHKINVHATFVLDVPEDAEDENAILCTTHLPVDEGDEEGMRLIAALLRVAKPEPMFAAFTISTR